MLNNHTIAALHKNNAYNDDNVALLEEFYKTLQLIMDNSLSIKDEKCEFFYKSYGLCSNLWYFLCVYDCDEVKYDRSLLVYFVLKDSFEDAELDCKVPFNHKHFDFESEERYKNPKRLAWIKSNVYGGDYKDYLE